MTRFSILFVTSVAFVACSKSSASKPAAVKLAKLNLQIEAPGEVEVSDGMGDISVMLMGPGVGAMQVEIPKTPQSLDEAKSDAQMYNPKNQTEEKLADGWVLSFENTGSMGKNYFVQVRRDIGGKTYLCTTTNDDAGRAKAVIAACKSLKP